MVVAAFEGWNDAGDAASGVVEHLALIWDATPLAEIESEGYYDYQINRPTIRQVDGVTRRIEWPSTTLSRCRPPGSDRDVILVHGIEPNMRWRSFCAELLDIFEQMDVDTVVVLGALLADTAHTRPVPVSGSAYSVEAAKRYRIEQTTYEGPTGITGVLQDAAVRAGMPAINLWAGVPHYFSQSPNPKVMVALLQRVEEVLDLEVPLGDLPKQAVEWEATVTAITDDDPEITEYIKTLEERGDAENDTTKLLDNVDGEALAADFERYLRRRDQEEN